MKIRSLLNLIMGLCILVISSSCASAQQPAKVPEDVPTALPYFEGKHVLVHKTLQKVYYRDGNQIIKEGPCGTGTEFGEDDVTPVGDYRILEKLGKDYVSNKFGSPMPYAMSFRPDRTCLHGSFGFVKVKGKGQPQSGGCVRMELELAKWLDENVSIGTPVYVRGDHLEAIKSLGFTEFFDYSDGKAVMKINQPNPSPEVIQQARKAFLEKRMFIAKPGGTTDPAKCLIGFPSFPKETRMSLKKFEGLVLTPAEKKRGIHILLDDKPQ